LASATDREPWQAPKAGSPRITEFRLSAQPQKFETIMVTIGYKNGQLLRLRVILASARALNPWRWQKGSQLWGREWEILPSSFQLNGHIFGFYPQTGKQQLLLAQRNK